MIFHSSPKVNRTLITGLICIQWKFTTPDQLASPSKFCSFLRFFFFSTTEVITCSKVINDLKRYNSWTDTFRKARHGISILWTRSAASRVRDSQVHDLKWNSHVDYIIKETCKKLLYSLRVLRRARVSQPNIMRIYLSTVRPVLEYAVPVWQNIPAYLSEAIERVQKRALNIIYPEAESYAHALQLGKLDRLDDRRVLLCYKYMAKMKSPSHPLHHLLPSPLLDAPNYTLRQKTQNYYLFRNTQVCRTKRVEDFFTFKYFKWFNCYYHCYNCKLLSIPLIINCNLNSE